MLAASGHSLTAYPELPTPPTVRQRDHVTRLDLRRSVLDQAEVVASRPELATKLRIEEREVEAGGLN